MTMIEKLRTALADRYDIIREIGAGGMATVYLARDLRHEREVALKLLKPELGAVLGPERFLSEIRVTAKLQHPNLLPLFDSGENDGQLWYVMPFVEGESLRARMERERQLSVREAVRLASAVASALDYAHRHGVIHRDLKPENILLHEDQPLVADFGIALAVSNAGGERVTQTGLSLGTPQYMSPEQATGERGVDGRTDIYSLGAVLYEMLTGEPPHTGATVQAIIARLMTDAPRSVRATRPSVPEHVEWAVEKALEKVPADRFDSAKEFAEVLQGYKSITASRTAVARTAGPTSAFAAMTGRETRLPWIVAGIATLIAVGATAWGVHEKNVAAASNSAEPVSLEITPAGIETILPNPPAISPDGRKVVYEVWNEKELQLYVRNLGDANSSPLPGTENGRAPFFSPDGKWLGFYSEGDLRRIPFEGGAPIVVTGNISPRVALWLPDNTIVFPTSAITQNRSGLSRVSASGGTPRVLMVADTANGENLSYPMVLPDGETIVFVSQGPGGFDDDRLAIGSMKSGEYTVLDVLAYRVLGYVDGHAIFLQWDGAKGTLVAVPVEGRGRKVTGDPITLLGGIATSIGAAMSNQGTLAYVRGTSTARLAWLDRSGKVDTAVAQLGAYESPRISPDGRTIAFSLPGNPTSEVWLYGLYAKTLTRLTTGGGRGATWTPDGKRILFAVPTTAAAGLWIQPADGSGAAEQLRVKVPQGSSTPLGGVFSPDGETVVFVVNSARGRRDILYFKPGVDDAGKPWLATQFDERSVSFSPDGRWIAYVSNEGGTTDDVYVRPFPGPGPRTQISSGGGREAVWAKDGRQIFYKVVQQLMAADVSVDSAVTVQGRRSLLGMNTPASDGGATYDVAADGRVLFAARAGGDSKLVVIANWLTDVRRKLKEAAR